MRPSTPLHLIPYFPAFTRAMGCKPRRFNAFLCHIGVGTLAASILMYDLVSRYYCIHPLPNFCWLKCVFSPRLVRMERGYTSTSPFPWVPVGSHDNSHSEVMPCNSLGLVCFGRTIAQVQVIDLNLITMVRTDFYPTSKLPSDTWDRKLPPTLSGLVARAASPANASSCMKILTLPPHHLKERDICLQ